MSRRLIASVVLAAGLAVPASANVPPPCPPQPILQQDAYGEPVIVLRDPTQPCAYIRITVPVTIGPL